ncbi:aspartic and glutamic acid-rich protein isoform X2 [Labrus bergylta]|uniref:aspartic and glutamic acid-rich protein isoform X2 n=1 Tax=Labrus bergylta TaxID=56723 RepID=UPI0033136517
MYNTQSDEDDENCLYSSFWSDGERQEDDEKEEEEKVEIGRGIREKDFKPVKDVRHDLQEGSDKEKCELKNQEKMSWENSESGNNDDEREEEKEENVKTGLLVGNIDPKPISETDESLQEDSEEEKSNDEEDSSGDSSEGGSEEEAEEEEKEEISEEDSKAVDNTEDSLQEDSEEDEKTELNIRDNTSGDSLESEDEEEDDTSSAADSLQEASEEEKLELTNQENISADSSEVGSEKEEEEDKYISEEDPREADFKNPQNTSGENSEEGSDEEERGEECEDIGEEDYKHVREAEDSLEEASGEENPELNQENTSRDSMKVESEEEEDEQLMDEEDLKPVSDKEESPYDASEKDTPELNNQDDLSLDYLKGRSEEEEEEEEEKSCCSSSDSPAPSLMTSGYGTYRPEEHEGGDYRDDHTITEFDQDSRGDLSEVRDEEDDRSICSFGGLDTEQTHRDYSQTQPLNMLANSTFEAYSEFCRDEKEVGIKDMKPEENKERTEETFEDLYAASNNKVTTSEHLFKVERDNERRLEGGSVDVQASEEERHKDNEECNVGREAEDRAESDESSSNKDIKFIDSKADVSWMTYNKKYEEWEGNLRQKKVSCLEDRLAELRLSPSAQREFESENEDVSSPSETLSSEAEGISMSAFESYFRGMTRSHSDGDIRPKPKSFIRPVMNPQTVKKTDPVAKYFHYKQLWEMFKLPGETDRRVLRREIKLAYQPPPPKPRRVYVPNTYTVPTEKKRSALRWEIRNDLANGLLPHKFSYRF